MENPALSAGYEFDSSEEGVIGDAARWVAIWAWFAMIAGAIVALTGVFTLPGGLGEVAIGAVYLIIGFFFRGAGSSLKSVVETEGDDIAHLLSALDNVGSAFKIMVIVTAIGLILGIIAGVMGAA